MPFWTNERTTTMFHQHVTSMLNQPQALFNAYSMWFLDNTIIWSSEQSHMRVSSLRYQGRSHCHHAEHPAKHKPTLCGGNFDDL